MEEEGRSWLEKNLPEYIEQCFEDLNSIALLTENDLREIGITQLGKRKKILG